MTTREAIKIAEIIVEKSNEDMAKGKYAVSKEADRRNTELMEALLEAAKQGQRASEHSEIMEELKADGWLVPWAVRSAIGCLEEAIEDIESAKFFTYIDGDRVGFIAEPVLYTALAALHHYRDNCKNIEEDEEGEHKADFDIEGDVDALPKEVLEGIKELSRKMGGAKVIVEKRTVTVEKADKEKTREQL